MLGKQYGLCVSLVGLLCFPLPLAASTVSGRFTVGGYMANENFNYPGNDSASNNFSVFSARSYLHVQDFGEDHLDFVSDLRDKYDFFDQLDSSRMALTGGDTFQVRQMAVRQSGETNGFAVGRFPVPEAGAAYADGAEVSHRWTEAWRSGLFAGLNPHHYGQAYLQTDPNQKTYGLYSVFQPKPENWLHSIYSSQAVVVEQVAGDIDRTYWFETINYQWDSRRHMFVMSYLDFVPFVRVQTGILQYEQPVYGDWSVILNALAIDAIEYFRQQDLREYLPSSAYKEVGATVRTYAHSGPDIVLSSSYGQRLADGLTRNENTAGLNWTKLWSTAWDAYTLAGFRKNFESQDVFLRSGGGYFSEVWELTLDTDVGQSVYTDGTIRHPFSVQLGIARYLTNQLFGVIDFETIHDETFTNVGASFHLTYRFGSQALAPLREGAAPRGRL